MDYSYCRSACCQIQLYAADGLEIPVRDAYDASVQDNNPENYAAIVAAQGPDTRYTRLWWDVR